MMNKMKTVRLAKEDELEQINALRKQVYALHAIGEPSFFNEDFSDELRKYISTIWDDPQQDIIVNERNGRIVGFAVVHHFYMPNSPFMKERDYLEIEEFCVDKSWRRSGVATELVNYIRGYAKERNIRRIELSVWEFNEPALLFYESVGFKTYRRYMNMVV